MCAIIDANVVSEVFGLNRSGAGEKFYEWLNCGNGVLVIGGRLRGELLQSSRFENWAYEAYRAGRLRHESDEAVSERTNEIEKAGAYSSDDPHVLALAQISGARLLYTNDRDLQRDFNNNALINNPRGKVYSTLNNERFTKARKQLLANRELCRSER